MDNSVKLTLSVGDLDLDPLLTHGSLGLRELAPKRHLDLFSRFRRAHPCDQMCDICVVIGCIYAVHAMSKNAVVMFRRAYLQQQMPKCFNTIIQPANYVQNMRSAMTD